MILKFAFEPEILLGIRETWPQDPNIPAFSAYRDPNFPAGDPNLRAPWSVVYQLNYRKLLVK